MLAERGGCTSKIKCLLTYVDTRIFHCFGVGELTPEFCPGVLNTPSIAYHLSLLWNKPAS